MKVAMEVQGEIKGSMELRSHGSARRDKRINGIVGKVAMEVQGEIKGSMELLRK